MSAKVTITLDQLVRAINREGSDSKLAEKMNVTKQYFSGMIKSKIIKNGSAQFHLSTLVKMFPDTYQEEIKNEVHQ